MPLYEYAPLSGHCDRCHGRFEVMQRLSEDKLTACPDCGQACERQICAVALGGRYSTSNASVEKSGMTKYQKAGDGVYERVAGKGGPEHIFRK